MLEKTTCKKIVKKDPLRVAARLARRHVARAAWADAGMRVPPPATPACGLAHTGSWRGGPCRHPR
jgi:hypothetical protein